MRTMSATWRKCAGRPSGGLPPTGTQPCQRRQADGGEHDDEPCLDGLLGDWAAGSRGLAG